MNDTPNSPGPDQIAADTCVERREIAAILRDLEARLADLAAKIPDLDQLAVIRHGGSVQVFASEEFRPPSVLEAQLGLIETGLELMTELIRCMETEVSEAVLVEQWVRQQGVERRARAARLSRARSRADLARQLSRLGRRGLRRALP